MSAGILLYGDFKKTLELSSTTRGKSALEGIDLCLGIAKEGYNRRRDVTLNKHAPHAIILGVAGSGKTKLLDFLLARIVSNYSPEQVTLMLLGSKRMEFTNDSTIASVEHVKSITDIRNLDDVTNRLSEILDETKRRQDLFSSSGYRDIIEYNKSGTEPLPHVIVVMDEPFITHTGEGSQSWTEFERYVVTLLKMGRYTCYHFIVTSQDWEGLIPKSMVDLFHTRIALSMPTNLSERVLGSGEAALLPKGGWCISLTNYGNSHAETITWHVPFISTEERDNIYSLSGNIDSEKLDTDGGSYE